MVYFVESFYVNVGAGDCAIHLLVDVPEARAQQFHDNDSKKDTLRPAGSEIVNAILLDGGHNELGVISNIRETIKQIETMYGIDCLKFDTIALSHWDGDHFRGAMMYLSEELHAEYNYKEIHKDVTKQRIINGSITNFRRFKYDATGMKTTFYSPRLQYAAEDSKTELHYITDHSEQDPTTLQQTNYLRMVIMSEDEHGDEVGVHTGGIAKICMGESAIGYDLFSGIGLVNGRTWRDLTNLQQLIAMSQAAVLRPTHPYFFCVGIEDKLAGQDAAEGASDVSSNASSMMCLLVWPRAGTELPKITLYTGGDAEMAQENRLVTWLRGTDDNMDYSVECIKLGHHGAATATSERIFNLNPDKFIISAGKEYGHPTFTTMCYLFSYCSKQGFDRTDPAILATRSPTWLDPRFLYRSDKDPDDPSVPNLKRIQEILRTTKGGLKRNVTFNLKKIYEDNRKTYRQFKRTLKAINPDAQFLSQFDRASKWTTVSQGFIAKVTDEYAFENKKFQDPFEYLTPGKHHTKEEEVFVKHASQAWYLAHVMAIRILRQLWNSHGIPRQPSPKQPIKEIRDAAKQVTYILVRAARSTASDMGLNSFIISLGSVDLGATKWRRPEGEKTLAAFEPDEEELLQEDSDESEDSRTKKRKATMRKKLKGEIKTNNHQSRKAEKKITMDKMVDRSISIEKDKMDGGSNKGKGDKGDNKRKKKGPGGARGLAGADQMFFAKEVSEASSLEGTIPNSNPAVAYDDLNPVRVFVRDIKMLQLPAQALNSFDLNHETSITLTWFRDFISAKQILVSGSVRDQSVTVDRIELKCQITDSAGSPYALEFSTAQEARETQFGAENGDKVDKIGYNQDDASLIFALTRCEKFSLGALMDIIELPSPKWVRALFGLVLLKPSSLSAPRSGIWYQPVWGQETTLRLEMEVDLDDGAAKPVVDFLKTHLGKIEIKNIIAVGKKFSETALNASPETVDIQTSSTAYLHTTLSWPLDPNNKPLDIHSTICVHPEGVDLIIQFPSGPDIFKLLFTWLNDRLKQSGTSEMIAPELQENLSQALTRLGSISFILKYVSLSFTSADGHPRLASFSAKFEVPLGFGAPQGKRCVALAGISWTPGSFQVSGEIWTSFAAIKFIPFSLNPTRELWLEMLKPNTENAITYLSLPNLIPGHTLTDYPHGIPDEITKGRIMVRFDADKNVILHISGTLQCGSQSSESPVPPIWLDKLHLSATYNFKTQAFAFLFKGVVDVRLDSEDNDDTPQDDMELKASVAHDSVTKSWRVTATALNLRFANIYSFFNKGSERGAVMSILSGISIPLLYVSYDYTKSQPSSFHLTGVINLGPLELDLLYDHKGTSWDLEAELKKRPNVGSNELTIEQILKGITDEIETLPDFLRNLALPLDKISLKLTCSRGQTHTDHIVFALELSIEPGFHLTFVQMQQYDPHKGSGTQPTPTPAPSPSPSPVFPTKRLIRVALTKLPPVKDIPLVEKLEQPFDQMGFLWLNEDLSRAEVAVMNTEVFKKPGEDLLFKDKVKSTSPTDCVLKAGSHFQIALKIDGRHEVVLDHVFDATDHKDKAPAPGPVSPSPGQPPHGDPHPSPSPDKPPPGPRQPAIDSKNSKSSSHAPVKKKMANISIQNMGLKLEKSTLNIILDASVTLGPISVSLLQFSLDIDLSKIKKLEDFLDIPVSFSIAGLALQYSKPPTTIAGAIKRLKGGNGDGYAGGLAITLSQWAFMAAGLYETINSKHDGKTYRTIFAFAKLEGPLVELEFVEIHGITGGFGYNSKIRFPTISEVTKFPFVTISTGSQPESNDPKSQLLALTDTGGTQGGWFTPQNDSFWLAAGLGIRAFQVLDVQAVISVDLSSDFRLGIFGEGLAVEPVGVSPDSQFLVVDLGFSAVVDPSKGIFCVSGELTPRSFILSRSCHLTGGFALAYFFEGSGHDGDWVFTVGGFHPAYNVPSHYPVPPRVGISWSYDDSFSITGAAYFAITPDCCMGGGRLDAIYASGRVRASFSAYADFLINFRPFQFKADVGVGVDVYATIGWGFLSHKVHLEVDALVELHGPPLAGTAHLHMWFISISIRFGPDKTIQDKLSLKNFLIMVKQAENEQKANAIPDFILQARKGVQDDSPSMVVKQDQEWLVRGSVLEFEIQSRVPIRGVACNDKRVDKLNEQRPVYSKPMRLNKSLTSEMVIDIVSQNNQRPVFQQAPTLKNVPTAIWGQYDEHTDPEKGGLSILKADRSKAMISHVMGVVISSPEPLESKDNIPPFDPHKLNSLDVIEPPVIPNGEPPSPGSVPTKAPGANSEEQVKEVVSRWKKADFNMRTSILDQFVQFVDPLKDKGKVSKLYKGLHAAGRTPEKYLEQAREHLREAPMVC